MTSVVFEARSYSLKEGESMLGALLRGGANINFSCRKGSCQACLLQLVDGDAGDGAQAGLNSALIDAGCFLPCQAYPTQDVTVARPNPADLYTRFHLQGKEWLSAAVCLLRFEPELNVSWKAGQFVNLRRPDGLVRSYSITSIPEEDYFLEIHVKRLPDGTMSRWLCDEVEVGEVVQLQGPVGTCFYDVEHRDKNILMMATGSGLSPLMGVTREALLNGHTGQIHLYHGSREPSGLYLRESLRQMAAEHENFHYHASLTGEDLPEGVEPGRITDHAFARHDNLEDWVVYLCGIPDMVHEARYRAVLAGAPRPHIHADPFEYAHDFEPDDKAKMAAVLPEPELWEALGHGVGLTEILNDFYTIAFEDARLSPFFHRVTKQRAIEKQYAFLADLFTGSTEYFGLRPFNAHHWMIISDELFDYRERIFEDCVRRHGLPEHLIRRWNAVHELFRREIVKDKARGMIIDGEEHHREGSSEVVIEIATVCDGCFEEILEGETARFHNRTGELFCMNCGADAMPIV